jgi:hypothetical protein
VTGVIGCGAGGFTGDGAVGVIGAVVIPVAEHPADGCTTLATGILHDPAGSSVLSLWAGIGERIMVVTSIIRKANKE